MRLSDPSGRSHNRIRPRWNVLASFEGKTSRLDRDKRIWWGKNGTAIPQIKSIPNGSEAGRCSVKHVVSCGCWSYTDARQELTTSMSFQMLTQSSIHRNQQDLLQRILQIAAKPGDLILDSFAGSGTTGHAVLKLNQFS